MWWLSAWLMADLLSGLVHWWEDRYGDPSWPVLGPLVVEPNIRHHEDQKAFLAPSVWGRNWTAAAPAWTLAGILAACGMHWMAASLAALGLANEVHAWAHQRCSRPIRGLQLLGVLQSPEQHAEHHRRPFDRNYCTMTDWLNPVLSRVEFWAAIERVIGTVFGVFPRPERADA